MTTQLALKMLAALAVAAVVSFLTTPMVKSLAYKVGAIDVPKDNRRMHKTPIPRLGGLAIFIAFLLTVLIFADIDRPIRGILLGAVMIVVLGVLDDILTLKALPKLLVQIAAGCPSRSRSSGSSPSRTLSTSSTDWTVSPSAFPPFPRRRSSSSRCSCRRSTSPLSSSRCSAHASASFPTT